MFLVECIYVSAILMILDVDNDSIWWCCVAQVWTNKHLRQYGKQKISMGGEIVRFRRDCSQCILFSCVVLWRLSSFLALKWCLLINGGLAVLYLFLDTLVCKTLTLSTFDENYRLRYINIVVGLELDNISTSKIWDLESWLCPTLRFQFETFMNNFLIEGN